MQAQFSLVLIHRQAGWLNLLHLPILRTPVTIIFFWCQPQEQR